MSLMEGGAGGGLRTLKERGGQREWRHNYYFSDNSVHIILWHCKNFL